MKRILYYLKVIFMALLMSMAAFGMVIPGTLNSRKKYNNKDVTIELIITETEKINQENQSLK